MSLACLLLPIALLAPQGPTAAPDRSAEPKLRQIFEKYGKLRNAHIEIFKSARETETGPFFGDKQIVIWYDGPTKFRVTTAGYWGDAGLYVSDGKDMYIDNLDDNRPATLREMKAKAMVESSSDLSSGDPKSLMYMLLQGPAAMSKIVSLSGEIKELSNGAIRFQSREIGLVTLYRDKDDMVSRIEYDNLPIRLAQYRLVPFFFDKPSQPLEREEVSYISLGRRLPNNLFSTKPPKGRRVTDERKKPPASK